MPDISLLGAIYSDVPSVVLPTSPSGTAQFDYTTIPSDAATVDDIANGKKAWVNGQLLTGTGSGGGVDGDNLGYGVALVGSAIVGSSSIV